MDIRSKKVDYLTTNLPTVEDGDSYRLPDLTFQSYFFQVLRHQTSLVENTIPLTTAFVNRMNKRQQSAAMGLGGIGPAGSMGSRQLTQSSLQHQVKTNMISHVQKVTLFIMHFILLRPL